MARGAIRKQNVINKIKEAFGTDFIGEYDKKILISFKNYAQSNLVEELIELLNKYYRLIAFENDI